MLFGNKPPSLIFFFFFAQILKEDRLFATENFIPLMIRKQPYKPLTQCMPRRQIKEIAAVYIIESFQIACENKY